MGQDVDSYINKLDSLSLLANSYNYKGDFFLLLNKGYKQILTQISNWSEVTKSDLDEVKLIQCWGDFFQRMNRVINFGFDDYHEGFCFFESEDLSSDQKDVFQYLNQKPDHVFETFALKIHRSFLFQLTHEIVMQKTISNKSKRFWFLNGMFSLIVQLPHLITFFSKQVIDFILSEPEYSESGIHIIDANVRQVNIDINNGSQRKVWEILKGFLELVLDPTKDGFLKVHSEINSLIEFYSSTADKGNLPLENYFELNQDLNLFTLMKHLENNKMFKLHKYMNSAADAGFRKDDVVYYIKFPTAPFFSYGKGFSLSDETISKFKDDPLEYILENLSFKQPSWFISRIMEFQQLLFEYDSIHRLNEKIQHSFVIAKKASVLSGSIVGSTIFYYLLDHLSDDTEIDWSLFESLKIVLGVQVYNKLKNDFKELLETLESKKN